MLGLERKPDWLKVRMPSGENYSRIKSLLRGLDLHTVCEEARCPNVGECWGSGTATIMLLGDTCTRGCRFCAVQTGNPGGVVDPFEPLHVSVAIRELGLEYVVFTSVDRDDLPDQGAGHIAATIRKMRELNPDTLVEVLVPDFRGDPGCIRTVVEARPDVYAHNVETVPRLTPTVRDRRATYRQSLDVLRLVKEMDPSMVTKSSLMLGLGETEAEVVQAMRDLREVGCDILTLGQYLRPSDWHLEVRAYVPPEAFESYRRIGEGLGFKFVASGPLVRSSYRAGEFFVKHLIRAGRDGAVAEVA
ncbi:MAG: lipoyl synthase [Methanobacteriota archaeon]